MKARGILLCLIVGHAFSAHADSKLSVAVATNFLVPFKAIAAELENRTGIKVRVISGSTGKLVTQLLLGAPHDVIISADQTRVELLIEKGLAERNSHITYAIGQLALWAPGEKLCDKDITEIFPCNYDKVAIANPKLAPYGLASKQTLESIGEKTGATPGLVITENVGQVYSAIMTGNLRMGFLAFSYLKDNPNVDTCSYILVTADHHEPIKQDAAVLVRAKHKAQAKSLLDFMQSARGKELIKSFGYLAP